MTEIYNTSSVSTFWSAIKQKWSMIKIVVKNKSVMVITEIPAAEIRDHVSVEMKRVGITEHRAVEVMQILAKDTIAMREINLNSLLSNFQ